MSKSTKYLLFLSILILFTLPALTGNVDFSANNPLLEDVSYTAADGESWLTGWQARQKLTFYMGTISVGFDYQVDLIVNYDDDVINQADMGAQCQTDFGDIQYTEVDGITLLDYWMEVKVDSDYAKFWIEVSDELDWEIITSIYIYYKTSGTSTTSSNGPATFVFFDDFEDGTLDKWDSVTNFEVKTDRARDTYSASRIGTTAGNIQELSYGTNDALLVSFYFNIENTLRGGIVYFTSDDGNSERSTYLYLSYESTMSEYYRYDTISGWQTWTGSADDMADDTWHHGEYAIDFKTDKMQTFQNDVQNNALDVLEVDGTTFEVENLAGNIFISPNAYQCWYDDIYVRKWNEDGEPYVGLFGSEELATITNTGVDCSNIDDTNNFYAQYKEYDIETTHTVIGGLTAIDYVLLDLIGDIGGTPTLRWGVKWVESTDVFSEESGGVNIILDVDNSYAEADGNDVTIHWLITFEWIHPDEASARFDIDSDHDWGDGDDDSYSPYDVETNLIWQTSPTVTDDDAGTVDRGDLDEIFSITGDVEYNNSASHVGPPSAAVDIWVSASQYGTNVGPWETDTLTNGAFTATCYADDAIGSDTYTIIVVEEGDGSGGTDLVDGASPTDTYIADMIEIYSATVTDGRIDVSTQGTTTWHMRYDHLNQDMGDVGTFILNGSKTLIYVTTNTWQYQETKTSVQAVGYEILSIAETTHGITGFFQSVADPTIIWDEIEVYYSTTFDLRDNIGDQNYPVFRLRLKYDNHLLNDGTNDGVNINGSSATWYAPSTYWYKFYTMETVGSWNFVVTSASENTYGITALDSASAVTYGIDIIWDSLTITITDPTDQRNNINANATGIYVSAVYDYDSEPFDGTLTLNSTTFSYATAQRQGYTVATPSGDSFGITAISTNDDTYHIWDEIEVYWSLVFDGRDDIGDQNYPCFRLRLKYDNHLLNDGTNDAININGSVASWYGAGPYWYKFYTMETVGSWNFLVTSANEDTYGITSFDSTSAITYDIDIIWDRVYAVSLSYGGDTRINIGTSVNFDYELHYDYDESDVTDGTITVNGESFTHQGSGVWRYTTNGGGIVGDITFDSIVASGNVYGITVTTTDGNDVTLIWDRVYAVSLSYGGDTRVDTSTTINFDWELHYDYDEADVTTGTHTVNGYALVHQSSGVWRYTNSSTLVGDLLLNSISLGGDDAFGITAMFMNSKTVTLIWDRVKVLLIASNSTYNDLNDYVLLTVSLEYEFDSDAITTGTFSLRYGSTYLTLTHDASGDWIVTDTSANSLSRTYNAVNGTATLYGITVINMNGKSATVHWDRILITLDLTLQWTIVDYNISVRATGIFEGNESTWTGTITFNATWDASFYPTQTAIGNYTYTVTSISGILQGFLITNPEDSWCIWDDISMSSGPAYEWTQYSTDEVWLIIDTAKFTWSFNGSNAYDIVLQSKINATDDDWGIVNADGYIGDLILGGNPTNNAFDTSWYYANISIYAQTGAYDWIIWTRVLKVDILHTLNIDDSGMDVQDEWITFIIHTNRGNSTFTIWDNMTGSFLLVGYSSSEGWYPIARPTDVGTHWYWVLVNSTHSGSTAAGQTGDPNLTDDWWIWLDFKFTVNPVTLSITGGELSAAYDEVSYSGTSTKDAVVTIYEDNIQVGSTTISMGDFAFFWIRASSTEAGNTRYALKFVNGTGIVWRNGSYSKVLTIPFIVENWDLDLHLNQGGSYTEGVVQTSWENSTIYAYDNGMLMATITEGVGGTAFYWWMSETAGIHVIVLNITHGATVHTRTTSYYIPEWATGGMVGRYDIEFMQENTTIISAESNWGNTTVYVYLDSVLVATITDDPGYASWDRAENHGTFNLTIIWDGGSQNYTIAGIIFTVTEEGTTYVTGGVHYPTYEGDVYEGDTHENPPGFYITAETAAIIAVSGVFIAFIAYLAVDRLLKKKRLDVESEEN